MLSDYARRTMISQQPYRALFLGAGTQMQCGVGQFTQRLRETTEKLDPGGTAELTLTRRQGSLRAIWQAVGSARSIVCNFPIVAWKRVVVRPLLALAIARLRGRRAILIQHEWAGLHPLRRLSCVPALLLADKIMTFSPRVRRELAADPLVGWTERNCVLAPLPPNIEAPAEIADTELRRRLAAARQGGRPVIGHFGSIYPGKQPNGLLQICAVLGDRGVRPLIVYLGSFIRGMDRVEDDLHAKAAELGLIDDVIVSGYVADTHELFGLFGQIDVFCYPLREGLTARRASILACVQSGRPVVVTGPAEPSEFNHHPRFKGLIDRGAIVLVPRGAGPEAYADAVVAALRRPTVAVPFDFDGWWLDAVQALRAELSVIPAAGTAPDSAARVPRPER